jgi:hypothetical protein
LHRANPVAGARFRHTRRHINPRTRTITEAQARPRM